MFPSLLPTGSPGHGTRFSSLVDRDRVGSMVSALGTVGVDLFWKLQLSNTGERLRRASSRLLFIIPIRGGYFDRSPLSDKTVSVFLRQLRNVLLVKWTVCLQVYSYDRWNVFYEPYQDKFPILWP